MENSYIFSDINSTFLGCKLNWKFVRLEKVFLYTILGFVSEKLKFYRTFIWWFGQISKLSCKKTTGSLDFKAAF